MKPAYSDDWTSIYSVDALTGASLLPEKSVHCIVTSPPYWGLRSYLATDHPDKAMELGAEKTPEAYVEKLVEVFRALRRVLRDDGTLWLNLGDSYQTRGGVQANDSRDGGTPDIECASVTRPRPSGNLKSKDLVSIPWMVAFALRADGWYLRSDIIWSKPNPMPESVTDRPTKSHEYVFLLTKSPRYFFDVEAVKEKAIEGTDLGLLRGRDQGEDSKVAWHAASIRRRLLAGVDSRTAGNGKRNIRSVWNIATQPYPGAHYATFPPALIYPCIKAGTSERGVCEACGAPWERVVERDEVLKDRSSGDGWLSMPSTRPDGYKPTGLSRDHYKQARSVGWQPTCSCGTNTVPATVLDPFMGSGTTALAARKLGRRSIGFDLDERNIKQIEERLGTQGVLL